MITEEKQLPPDRTFLLLNSVRPVEERLLYAGRAEMV